jgi:hypothetical protein
MFTAAITALVAGLLSLFGVKPGPYLVAVAIGVMLAIVAIGVVFGSRYLRRREARKSIPSEVTPADE